MAPDTTFNGYTNWATWNLCLWFDNDEGLYRSYREQAGDWDSDSAREHACEIFPNGTTDMNGPGDMADVDWDEVAEQWNQED